MTRQEGRIAILRARVRVLQQVAFLEGGFAELVYDRNLSEWKDLIEPWAGQARLVPAVSATGLSHWRHGTVHDLVGWVLSGCQGWEGENRPVVVAGTRYRTELPVVGPGPQVGGDIRMLTRSLTAPARDTPNAWMRALVRQEPNALALCIVPRG